MGDGKPQSGGGMMKTDYRRILALSKEQGLSIREISDATGYGNDHDRGLSQEIRWKQNPALPIGR